MITILKDMKQNSNTQEDKRGSQEYGMFSVKRVRKEAFHSQKKMAENLRVIYEIINVLKKIGRYGCSLFQVEKKEPNIISNQYLN